MIHPKYQKRSHGLIAVIFFGIISLLVSGCGGSGDENNTIPQQDPTGIWDGKYTSWTWTDDHRIANFSSIDIYGVIWKGRWILFRQGGAGGVGADRLWDGNPVVVEQVVTGDMRSYDGRDFLSVEHIDYGGVSTKDYLHAEYRSNVDPISNMDTYKEISMYYQSSLTEIGSSLTYTDGIWSEQRYSLITTLAIDANGLITGSDTNGCVYNGIIKVPDESINIYEVEVDLAMCGDRDGNYSGLGFFSLENRNVFRFSVSNPDHSFILILNRV